MNGKHRENTHRRGRKREYKKNRSGIKIFIIIIIMIVFVGVAIVNHKDKLCGSWKTDGGTKYKFDGKGKGALITSLSRYEFSYTIKKNNIYIDFLTDKAKDASYEYSIEDTKLTIKGIDNTDGTYTLTKE